MTAAVKDWVPVPLAPKWSQKCRRDGCFTPIDPVLIDMGLEMHPLCEPEIQQLLAERRDT